MDNVEKYILEQTTAYCLKIPKIEKLIKKGRVSKLDIEQACIDIVARQRSGMAGRMRGSDCIEAAEKQLKSKYKGMKL